jgi:hypothetical protein
VKQIAAIFGVLWRATLLFPLAVAFCFLVIGWLVLLPSLLLIYAFTETSWAWAGLAAWLLSLYVFRKPMGDYFQHRDSDGYL